LICRPDGKLCAGLCIEHRFGVAMPFAQLSGENSIRVLVADNTRIHTQLLADALRRDRRLQVIAAASPSRDLLEAITTHSIDVVVVSSHLDEEPLRGLEVLRELRASRPQVRAVILLDSSKREIIVEAFRAGARGVFSRHESLETLSKCVRQVYAGQIWANEQQMIFAIEALAASPTVRAVGANGLSLLSKREIEVIHLLAEGLTNRDIAERLGLSQHTIKNYLFHVFDKLGVSSRMELLSLTLSQPATRTLVSAATGPGPENENRETDSVDRTLAGRQKAADQGEPAAQIALARMYWHGKGVPKDMVSAYMWYLVSERTSLDMKEEISAAKRKLAESLTTEQVVEAQRKASAWLKKPPQATSPVRSAAPSGRLN
jgi:DNA-binding NarL/FixJ family response regulator